MRTKVENHKVTLRNRARMDFILRSDIIAPHCSDCLMFRVQHVYLAERLKCLSDDFRINFMSIGSSLAIRHSMPSSFFKEYMDIDNAKSIQANECIVICISNNLETPKSFELVVSGCGLL